MFDECHKAKNASSTKMGKAVLDLQSKLPQARVVYASATGGTGAAAELGGQAPSHMWPLVHLHRNGGILPAVHRTLICAFSAWWHLGQIWSFLSPCHLLPDLEGTLDTLPRTSVLVPWPPHFPGVMTLYLTQLPASNQPLGASEPRNMIYMSRLGIWGEGTPFRTFEEFLHAIEKR